MVLEDLDHAPGEGVTLESVSEATERTAIDELGRQVVIGGDLESPAGPVGHDENDRQGVVQKRIENGPCTRYEHSQAHAGHAISAPTGPGHAISPHCYDRPFTTSTILSPASVGFWATVAPTAASASIFACAVPWEPEMMAPAWPILRPGGAVTPAM